MKLCREVSRESEEKYLVRLVEVEGLKPVHVGISEYLRLDSTGNIVEVFKKMKKLNEIPEETTSMHHSSIHEDFVPQPQKDDDWEFIERDNDNKRLKQEILMKPRTKPVTMDEIIDRING